MRPVALLLLLIFHFPFSIFHSAKAQPYKTQVAVLSATPAGIAASLAAARHGAKVLLIERQDHIGGLPANGLGATDIHTRALAGGIFREFTDSVRRHYVRRYGAGSRQVQKCSDGFHFEPHVAEAVFEAMLKAQPNITVIRGRRFDAIAGRVRKRDTSLTAICLVNETDTTEPLEWVEADQFIDATYEGDLAAAAGAPFVTGREGREEYGEYMAGRFYKGWKAAPQKEFSTGEADTAIQAYNFRICITDSAENRIKIEKPDNYNRNEYLDLLKDIKDDKIEGFFSGKVGIVNGIGLPNRKWDANNHHANLTSTDLPEENWPWPRAGWEWRDNFALRLENFERGLIYFVQNDEEVPRRFREECSKYGLAKDEYLDNGHFPRQVYVREARRMKGPYFFTAKDALPVADGLRPPVHSTSIAASHYAIDSHGCRKREPGRDHQDGFLSYKSAPYTIPYGVILPKKVGHLLVPVAVSASHIGFGTLRMEPCWMALGQAAGLSAWLSIQLKTTPGQVPIRTLQANLLADSACLAHVEDVPLRTAESNGAQLATLYGGLTGFAYRPQDPAKPGDLEKWFRPAHPGRSTPGPIHQPATRGEAAKVMSLFFMKTHKDVWRKKK